MTLKSNKIPSAPSLRYPNSFPSEVISFTTCKPYDFSFPEGEASLSVTQSDELNQMIGFEPDAYINIRQVHGKDIEVVDKDFLSNVSIPQADGLVTNLRNIVLLVRTADCLPIFLFDKNESAIGLVHAGWKSTKAEIVIHAVKKMEAQYGTKTDNIEVAFGPCIRRSQYEVGKEFLDYFPKETSLQDGRYFFDLAQANFNQLLSFGIKESNIVDCCEDTFTNEDLHSFRREGAQAGRMVSCLLLKE